MTTFLFHVLEWLLYLLTVCVLKGCWEATGKQVHKLPRATLGIQGALLKWLLWMLIPPHSFSSLESGCLDSTLILPLIILLFLSVTQCIWVSCSSFIAMFKSYHYSLDPFSEAVLGIFFAHFGIHRVFKYLHNPCCSQVTWGPLSPLLDSLSIFRKSL